MRKFDPQLFWSLVILAVFGLVMMSSMSIAASFDVTGENDFYFWRHFRYLLLGIPAFFLGISFPIAKLRQWSTLIFLLGIGLLITTLIIGQTYGTFAKLWLKIGSFSFQPVEITKLALIIFMSALFSSNRIDVGTLEGGFIPFAVVLSIPALLLIMQSDFGSLLVIGCICAAIYYAAGANIKHFFGGIGIGAVATLIASLTVPYIGKRMRVFLDPSLDTQNTGFQVKQALIAIGSGKLFGRGFQNSIQKFDYLPEVQSDTIFAAIAEEMGFFRIILLVGLYLFIAWRGFAIAQKCHDTFSRLLAVGISVWITGQAFINIGVNMALLPNTGITLPLLSYGGSSMIMTFLSFGILLQLSKNLTEKKRRRW